MSAKTANKTKKPTMADKADIHELYEESVQNVANEVEFLSKTFRAVTGRTGYLFREDFCGTASLACEWAKQGPEFSAIGVDIDPSVHQRSTLLPPQIHIPQGRKQSRLMLRSQIRYRSFCRFHSNTFPAQGASDGTERRTLR